MRLRGLTRCLCPYELLRSSRVSRSDLERDLKLDDGYSGSEQSKLPRTSDPQELIQKEKTRRRAGGGAKTPPQPEAAFRIRETNRRKR